MDADADPLRRLEALVGEWNAVPVIDGQEMGTALVTFEWLGDQGLVRQQVQAQGPAADPEWEANSPLPVDAVIGLDDYTGRFTMLYADARGVRRVYAMDLDEGVWTMEGRPSGDFHQRFEGTFSDDGNRIDARWDHSADGSTWAKDFDMVYTRVA
jgi:hypothetical protein